MTTGRKFAEHRSLEDPERIENDPLYYISAETIICEGQDLTIQTLSSVMATSSLNIVFGIFLQNTTFQTEVSDTGKLPMQILPFRTRHINRTFAVATNNRSRLEE